MILEYNKILECFTKQEMTQVYEMFSFLITDEKSF